MDEAKNRTPDAQKATKSANGIGGLKRFGAMTLLEREECRGRQVG